MVSYEHITQSEPQQYDTYYIFFERKEKRNKMLLVSFC